MFIDESIKYVDSELDSDEYDAINESSEESMFDDFDENSAPFNELAFKLAKHFVKSGWSHNSITGLLKILRENGHPDLPKTAKSILNTPIQRIEIWPCESGEFYYYGIEKTLMKYDNNELAKCEHIVLDINLDGLSLSKSSQYCIWPIMGSLVDMPNFYPFVIGAYSGYAHPTDPDIFLRVFVDEVKALHQTGVFVTRHKILKPFTICCFINDTPAETFFKG